MKNKELVKELYDLHNQLRSEGKHKEANLINQAYLRIENLAYFKEEMMIVLGKQYKGV